MKFSILIAALLLFMTVTLGAQTDEAASSTSTTPETAEVTTGSKTDSKKQKETKLTKEQQLERFFGAVMAGDASAVANSIDPMFYYRHNANGETALTQAIQNNDVEMVRWLEKNQAVINVKNKAGETPLTLAIKNGNPEIIDIIVTRSSANLRNDEGMAPLSLALDEYSKIEFLELLISKGADVNRISKGITPLSRVTQKNNIQLAAFLIKNGADPSKPDENGDIPLAIAVTNGYEAIAGMLMHNSSDAARDANWKNNLGVPVLNLAAEKGYTQIVNTLLKYGANPNATDYMDNTALSLAAQQGNQQMADLLISSGADVNHQNMMGITPITAAAEGGHASLAQALAYSGADPYTRSYEGMAASDYYSFTNPTAAQEGFLEHDILRAKSGDMKAAFGSKNDKNGN